MEEKKQQAQQFEDQGRMAIKEKRYDDAIKAFKVAIQIYRELQFDGQVGILVKEIKRIESLKAMLGEDSNLRQVDNNKSTVNIKDLEKEANILENKIKQMVFDKSYLEAINLAQQLITIYEKLNYSFQIKKLSFEIEKFKLLEAQLHKETVQTEKTQDEMKLSIAEERALRIKKLKEVKEAEDKKRLEEFEQAKRDKEEALRMQRESTDSKVKKASQDRMAVFEAIKTGQDVSFIRKEAEERQKKLEEMQKKKQLEEKLLAEANYLMDLAKSAYEKHEFEDAIKKYQNAADIFKQLGWNQQAEVLYKEVLNVKAKQIELQKKQAEDEALRRKQQEEFEARARQMQAELEEKKRKEMAERNKLPPEILRKIETLDMVLEKAKELEEKQKFDKALARYESFLELIKEIPSNVDFMKKIEFVNSKIKELKEKIPLAP